MADTITITDQDRIDAESVLEQFLTDRLPDLDFSKGGALRDFVVQSLAYIFAYFQHERDLIMARQSLLLLGKLSGSDIDDAVDEILSNWFIQRKDGRVTTGVVTVHLSENEDIAIDVTARFYKTSSIVFQIDSSTTLTYSSDDMLSVTDSDGVTIGYTVDIPVKAVNAGTEYNVEDGVFVDYTRFSPYITKIENVSPFSNGLSVEATDEMLTRSETAITVRDLNSARSIDAVLKEEFSSVDDVVVIGYGDDEMQRDIVLEAATATQIHGGGYVDAYLRMPILSSRVFTGTVGGTFTDPREKHYILRDPTIANEGDFPSVPETNFETYNVVEGDVLRIYNALETSEADQYIVKGVTPYGLLVSQRSPFPLALPAIAEEYADDGDVEMVGSTHRLTSVAHTFIDAAVEDGGDIGKFVRIASSANPRYNVGTGIITAVDPAGSYADLVGFPYSFVVETNLTWELATRVVSYTIGDNAPDYHDKISYGPHTGFTGAARLGGEFTKTVQNDGRVLLPAEPVYRITDVSLPGGSYPPALKDTDDRVRFPNRVNKEPAATTVGADLEYQLIGNNPEDVPSAWQLLELNVGYASPGDPTYFNDQVLSVTYDTLDGYAAVWSFMMATDRRILCGSVIPKGLHPVYLHFNINYRLSKTASETLDEAAAAQALAEFITNFNVNNDLDASDITWFLRSTYPQLGAIEPPTLYYDLLSPDGRVIYFKTDDTVSINPTLVIDPNTGAYPGGGSPELRLEDPLGLGVSNNTVRYLSVAALLTFNEV